MLFSRACRRQLARSGDLKGGSSGEPAARLFASGHPSDPTARYFADRANNRAWRIAKDGIITTVAGRGAPGVNLSSFAGDGGPAIEARLKEPSGVAWTYTAISSSPIGTTTAYGRSIRTA